MILVDSNIVSNYDFVRYTEPLHHINVIVVDSKEKGNFLFIFSRKKTTNNLSQIN